jgi:hypothetical protein
MSKHNKKIDSGSAIFEPENLKKIAIFYKNFAMVKDAAAHLQVKYYKTWARGNICYDENEIEELINLNAPVEIYFRYR